MGLWIASLSSSLNREGSCHRCKARARAAEAASLGLGAVRLSFPTGGQDSVWLPSASEPIALVSAERFPIRRLLRDWEYAARRDWGRNRLRGCDP